MVATDRRSVAAAVLTFSVLFSYWGIWEGGFIGYDDPVYVVMNRHLDGGVSLGALWWAFTTFYVGNWHPLTWVSLMVDRWLYGLWAGGYHLTNLVVHLFGVLVLFRVLERVTGRFWCSVLVALLFGVHPLHVESVAWVSERKDVLSGLFWMFGLWGYVLYRERPCFIRYILVFLFFVCGLMSKAMVVTFPFVLLLLDYWPGYGLGGRDWRRLVWEKVPLFILSGAASVVTLLAQQEGRAVASFSDLSLGVRLANAVVSYSHYLVKAFFPFGLAVFYPHPGVWPFWDVFLGSLLLVLVTVLVLLGLRRRPYLAVGWFWYVGMLVPVIGLVQVGSQAMADRYTYLPLIGVFLMVVWGVAEFFEKTPFRRTLAAILALATITTLIPLARSQVNLWKDETSLFDHAIKSTGQNFMAHYMLAAANKAAGKAAEAQRHYEEAIRLKPHFVEAHNDLGHLLMIQGRGEEAEQAFLRALKLRPAYPASLKNLGDIRLGLGRIDEAIGLYEMALQGQVNDPELFNNYGVALALKGRYTEAGSQFRSALALDYNYKEAKENLDKVKVLVHQ